MPYTWIDIDQDSAAAMEHAGRHLAHLARTLALPKVGLLIPEAAPYVGELYLADIGVPPQLYAGLGLAVGPLFAQGEILRLR